MFCSKCGAKMDDSCTFCTECGARLLKPVAPEVASVRNPGAEKTAVLQTADTAELAQTASTGDQTAVLQPMGQGGSEADFDPMAGIDTQVSGEYGDTPVAAPVLEPIYAPDSTAVMPPVSPVRTSGGKTGASKSSGAKVAMVAVLALVALALVGVGVAMVLGLFGKGESPAGGDAAGASAARLVVVKADASDYPQVKLTVAAEDDKGSVLTLDAAGVVVKEGEDADSLERVTSVTVAASSDDESCYVLTYSSESGASEGDVRAVQVSMASDSGYQGSADSTYKVTSQDDGASKGNAGDKAGEDDNGKTGKTGKTDKTDKTDEGSESSDYFILPDSDSRYLTKSDIEGMSVEELFYARNEIFARYGRGFQNEDLQKYFNAQPWYVKEYTPSEFDSMPSPLNDYEKKNVDLIREVEKAKGSPYL